jgi:Tfp pilus assembly protein PilX
MSVHAKNGMRKREGAMLTPAMLHRLLLALVALSLVRVFAVESSAMTNTHAVAHSKAAAFIANGWIYH